MILLVCTFFCSQFACIFMAFFALSFASSLFHLAKFSLSIFLDIFFMNFSLILFSSLLQKKLSRSFWLALDRFLVTHFVLALGINNILILSLEIPYFRMHFMHSQHSIALGLNFSLLVQNIYISYIFFRYFSSSTNFTFWNCGTRRFHFFSHTFRTYETFFFL